MIYIVFDTNMLYNSTTKYGDFSFNKNIDLFINFLKEEELTDKCSILIPRVVIDELKQQQKEHFYEDYKKIQDLLKQQGDLCSVVWNIDIDKYESYIESIIKNYIIQKKVEIIDVCSEKAFKKILEKALKKNPPFEGVEKKSDKGFKDAVIWQSLIEYSIQYGGSYIFYTSDKIFLDNKKYLSKDFGENKYRKIEFLNSIDNVRKYILEELKLNTVLDKYYERICDIKSSGCINKFFNIMEAYFDLLIVDGKTYNLRMINYDLKSISMPGLLEKQSLVYVDSEIGIYEDQSQIFYITFEIIVTKKDDGWEATDYNLVSKDDEFNDIEITME